MTSTPADGVDHVRGAHRRPPRALTAAPALIILLLAALALRVTIAYILFPASGFEGDLRSFVSWMSTLVEHGPGGFYANAGFADYPPGYMWILWLLGLAGTTDVPFIELSMEQLIKLPPMLADLGIGVLLYWVVTRWSSTPGRDASRLGLAAAGIYLFNPVTWYDSALWGQTDAVGALVMVAGVAMLLRGHSEGASAAAILAGLVKPQFGVVLAPVVAAVLLRRHLLAVGSGPQHRPWLPGPLARWLEREQGPVRLVTSAVVALVTLLVVITPFGLDIPGFIRLVAETAGGYPYLSVNAYNPWSLLGADGIEPLATDMGQIPWSSDTVPLFGPLPGVAVGTFLLAGGFLIGLARLLLRADRWSIVVVTIFLSLSFFVLPTRVHERYLFPAFAFLPLLAVADVRWRWATALLAIGAFINFHGILTLPLYGTDNVIDLPFGELFRTFPFVLLSVALQVGVFVFVAWQLRSASVRRPDPLSHAAAAGSVTRVPATGLLTRIPMATGISPGWAGLARVPERLRITSLRRDRSAELAAEPRGRFDRLDALLLLLIILAALTLRGYRVGQPYDMHFDEVYHARTATEFLQHWRYGIPHSIYEYTHPHLAKYGIALGLIAFGNDRVTGTTELGTAVTDAEIETRWSPAEAQGERDGDRLYVATGQDLRVYDLRERALVAMLSVPAEVIALDQDAHTLFAAADGGRVWSFATTDLDGLRSDPARSLPQPALLTTLTGLPAQVEGLDTVDGTVVVRLAGGTIASVDGSTGEQTGEAAIDGAAAVARIPQADRLVVDPDLVPDPVALADELADILDDDPLRIEELVAGASAPVAVAAYLDDETTSAVQDAIDEDRAPGASIQSGPTAAIAGSAGVTFVDAVSLEQLDQLTTDAPATDLVLVDRLDDPTLYVPIGTELKTMTIRDDGPAYGPGVPMPAEIRDVRWDAASNLVHVVGETPDGEATTVYVVEPHGNAVFADARLPFDPQATVMDIQPERPSDDRQALLALSRDGTVASVDVGSHAFAWRMPGVIMGALTAALVFLLARILFQRRSIGVIAAILVLVEGMFFANARIAMNDTYEVAFILAAVVLFAPLYLGIWRRPLAVVLVLPVVGVLLGLALATKWVGAYAIGFVLLLVLLRSALGRVIALAGMVGLTGLLGYLAVRPADVPDPRINATFLALMIGLTLTLAAAMVRRPVRFTLDELRFAVLAPAAAGAVLVLIGFAMGPVGDPARTGGLLTPNRILFAGAALLLLGAAAYGASWLAARYGVGPLAPPRPAARGEPVPATAPSGWLRPGWAAGIPWLYALVCLAAIPFGIYVISYLPWVELGNRILDDWPPGNTGQTLADLTASMYHYHDELRATHAASSPWWAWPLDLKPVWFHQDGFANSTTGVIHDTGNLVIFWMAIPAVAFAAWQAWVRRSLPLTMLVLGIACLWLPWARIDRATFQYHVFTSLPFAVLALAYFLAELWHGASTRTYLLARVAGAVAILGPPVLWLMRQPLCSLAGTNAVHPDGVACGPLVRTLTVAESALAATIVVLIGAGAIAWLIWTQARTRGAGPLLRIRTQTRDYEISLLAALTAVSLATAILAAVASLWLSPRPVFDVPIQAEILAIVALLLLAGPAYLAARARDPRRWVIGMIGAAILFFALWYPNLTGLPLPNTVAQAYLGLLPTWNYDFQFAVNLDPASGRDFFGIGTVAIAAAVAALVLVTMVAARSWRGARAPGAEIDPIGDTV